MGNNVLQFPATVARRRKSRKPLEPGSRAHRCQPRTNSTASGSRQPGVAHGHPPPARRLSPLAFGCKSPSTPNNLPALPAPAPAAGRQAGWLGRGRAHGQEVPPSARARGGDRACSRRRRSRAAAARRPPSPGDAPRGPAPAAGVEEGREAARPPARPAADPTPRATPPARLPACARGPRGGPPPGTPRTGREGGGTRQLCTRKCFATLACSTLREKKNVRR